jgi:Uma2 family endonuclease
MGRGLKRVLDYSDYLSAPDDGNRYEIIGGELYVTPTPTAWHQRVSRRLQRQLEDYFHARGLGEVFDAPVTLLLTNNDIVEPDLLVIADAGQINQRGVIEGVPLLVVEVASPSTARRDRTVKSRRFADLGIVHYWIVDPQDRRVECYALVDGAYEPTADSAGNTRLAHPAWDGLELDLTALWADSEAPRHGGAV